MYAFDETRIFLKFLQPIARFMKTFADQNASSVKVLMHPVYEMVNCLLEEVVRDVATYLINLVNGAKTM